MTPRRLALVCIAYVAILGAAYTWIRSVTPPGGWSEIGVVVLTLLANVMFLGGLIVHDERRKRMGQMTESGEAPGTTLAKRPLPLVAAALATLLPVPLLRFTLDDFSLSGLVRGMIMTAVTLLAGAIGAAVVLYGYRDLA